MNIFFRLIDVEEKKPSHEFRGEKKAGEFVYTHNK